MTTEVTPKKASRRGDRRERFLLGLQKGLSVSGAARAAGIARKTVYLWRSESVDFKSAWEAALEDGTDALEDALLDHALKLATPSAVTAAIFLLKARRPGKYRERPPEIPQTFDVTGATERLARTVEAALARVNENAAKH